MHRMQFVLVGPLELLTVVLEALTGHAQLRQRGQNSGTVLCLPLHLHLELGNTASQLLVALLQLCFLATFDRNSLELHLQVFLQSLVVLRLLLVAQLQRLQHFPRSLQLFLLGQLGNLRLAMLAHDVSQAGKLLLERGILYVADPLPLHDSAAEACHLQRGAGCGGERPIWMDAEDHGDSAIFSQLLVQDHVQCTLSTVRLV
mmetsp:Transcript_69446/g.165523  ORF Transcript_69446/g.165523 Transcript_69446/m.165523 type:complete len:202 (+) Transcript_69446:2299-2904(+)